MKFLYGTLEDRERKHSLYKEQLSREQRFLARRLEQLSLHFAMSKRRSVSECSSSTISSSYSTTSFSSAPSPISESGEYFFAFDHLCYYLHQ
ncbi:hypothetical protein JTB14_025158 [Gonioctena quinquepunctata]|nr:hypothetical protein JTB14_025158 [Gonioctena quinquepunctata]